MSSSRDIFCGKKQCPNERLTMSMSSLNTRAKTFNQVKPFLSLFSTFQGKPFDNCIHDGSHYSSNDEEASSDNVSVGLIGIVSGEERELRRRNMNAPSVCTNSNRSLHILKLKFTTTMSKGIHFYGLINFSHQNIFF